MTQNFVRYSPDVEHIEPDFDQTLKQVLDDMKQHMHGSLKTEGIGLVVRNAHAKGYGLAREEFEILSGLPNEYAQGIYAKPGRHEAIVRFSNGTNHVGGDRFLGPITGTLGHEIAGWVEEVGTGVTKFRQGDAVAVNPSWASCGRCHMCRSGEENHCLYQKAIRAPGVGFDGGHAPYVLVPEARFLVPIDDLDPVAAAPLTDAGITTYSAIKQALPAIFPGSIAVVIGVGGLGLYAVQFLRLLTGARVVAVDRTESRLKLAREYGADDVISTGPNAADQIRELTGGIGAIFIIDCVGANETLATAVSALSWRGRLAVVGAGGGAVPFDFFKVPPGAQLVTSLNGGSVALMEVVGMAALGRLKILVDRYPLRRCEKGLRRFRAWTSSRSGGACTRST